MWDERKKERERKDTRARDKGDEEREQKRIGDEYGGECEGEGSMQKSLRLAKLRNMETPELISGNRAADIGEKREEEGKIGGICKYFSNPRGKPRLPSFPPRLSGDYPSTIEPLPSLLFFPSVFFAFYRALLTPLFAFSFSLYLSSMRKKKRQKKRTKARVGNRGVLFFSFIYIGSRLIPARASSSLLPPFARVVFPDTRVLGGRPDGFYCGVIHCALCDLNAR